MITPYHAKYYALDITLNRAQDISRSLFDAQVDLNPHQIDAALFALKNPLQQGVLLADEVGLGKTIEAGLILCQLWAERKRQLMVVCPASLRKQWANELQEKFNLPSLVVDKTVIKKSGLKPQAFFNQHTGKQVLIVSHHFVAQQSSTLLLQAWDLVAIDEAHKLRNAHQKSNKMGKAIRDTFAHCKKILLTATPLQNSLMELYGLSTFLDDYLFGEAKQFRKAYVNQGRLEELKDRLSPYVKRTLRADVLEYVRYTKRQAVTQTFEPTEKELAFYEQISDFLRRTNTFALPASQRHLTGLILRKLLASSPRAIAATLQTILARLQNLLQNFQENAPLDLWQEEDLSSDYEDWDDESHNQPEQIEELEEISKNESEDEKLGRLKAEIAEIQGFIEQAHHLGEDSKIKALLRALDVGFGKMAQLGAQRKAIIFTESVKTQQYLFDFLNQHGYAQEVVMFSGTNSSSHSQAIYQNWLQTNLEQATGSIDVDKRTALIDHFKHQASIMIATEAGAEGVNLQFCSLLINYDLPWNPQRVEQRIGRCHRYGQKFDVVVINFLNNRNEADKRVLQLLAQKFALFEGVFGASDKILGKIESGLDIERQIAAIYDQCRTPEEIQAAFDRLQAELDQQIQDQLERTRTELFKHFDEDVLNLLKNALTDRLDKMSRQFWAVSQFALSERAIFEQSHQFLLTHSPDLAIPQGRYRLISAQDKAVSTAYHLHRLNSTLGEWCLTQALAANTQDIVELRFKLDQYDAKLSVIEQAKGQSGWLRLDKMQTRSEAQLQEELIFTACNDQGQWLDQDFCQKLLSLPADMQKIQQIPPLSLDDQARRSIDAKIAQLAEQNKDLIQTQMERIDAWAEDTLATATLKIEEAKEELREAKKAARLAGDLTEQKQCLEAQKVIERSIRRLRNEREELEDEIEDKKDELIAEIDRKLKQKTSVEQVFAIRWQIS
ncbi:ATP-dependent helicase [Pasteurellaceae bacterium RH1A]|nr:ATP-dependent helicase [Pasteurellaceae bacterium RH1A]